MWKNGWSSGSLGRGWPTPNIGDHGEGKKFKSVFKPIIDAIEI